MGVFARNSRSGFVAYLATQGVAGDFQGNVNINGDVNITGNVTVARDIQLTIADCAEEFNIAGDENIGPGTVMILEEGEALITSRTPYDTKIASVIAGGGDLRPGIVLGKQAVNQYSKRLPIAL